jgi:23S rRNA (uracil1939-C5)-methyltransferase
VPFVAPALIDVEIEYLNLAGDGVAMYRRNPIAVAATIPGERVRIEVPSGRSPAASGRLVEVLQPSPHRISPRCQHFGPCGGCAWQHIAYGEQLRIKTDIVTRLVRAAVPRAPSAQATLSGVASAEPWGYRQKVHFVFGSAAGTSRGLVMGHYARGSRQVVNVRECPVHDERGNALAFALRERIQSAGVRAADGHSAASRSRAATGAAGVVKSLAIRVGRATGELLATLVVLRDTDKRLRTATRALLATRDDVTGFHLNVHPRDDGFIYGSDTRRIAGAKRLREDVEGISFLISPTAFFQTNVQAAGVLVSLVVGAIPEGWSVLDLYAGAGLFAIPLARAGRRVVAVESHGGAVEDFEASARLNRLIPDQCRVIPRPVETASRTLAGFDAAVLDPPRGGCSPAVLRAVFGSLAPRLAVYVSCNPDTLARDLAEAVKHGYEIQSIQPVDMFPHTAHIETVVVLTRAAG